MYNMNCFNISTIFLQLILRYKKEMIIYLIIKLFRCKGIYQYAKFVIVNKS